MTFPSVHETASSHGCEDLLSQLEKKMHLWHFEATSHFSDLPSDKGRNKNMRTSDFLWREGASPCCVVYLYRMADEIPLLNDLSQDL